MESLKGVCASLEEFGYHVFDAESLNKLISEFGSPISRNVGSPLAIDQPVFSTGFNQTIFPTQNQIGQTTAIQPATSTQAIPAQASDQINKIQQQIGLLQQQLNQLQQTLGSALKIQGSSNAIERTIETTKNVIQSGVSSAIRSTLNEININDIAPSITNVLKSTSPTIIKAKLESHLTKTSPHPVSSQLTQHPKVDPQMIPIRFPTRRSTAVHSVGTLQQSLSNSNYKQSNQQLTSRASPFQIQRKSPDTQPSFQSTIDPAHASSPRLAPNMGFHNSQNLFTRPQTRHTQIRSMSSNSYGNNHQNQRNTQSHIMQQQYNGVVYQSPNQVQIQIEPLEFVQFQHQQSNSIEHVFGSGQPPLTNFSPSQQNSYSVPTFRSGGGEFVRNAVQPHGSGDDFIPNDSIEHHFGGVFTQR